MNKSLCAYCEKPISWWQRSYESYNENGDRVFVHDSFIHPFSGCLISYHYYKKQKRAEKEKQLYEIKKGNDEDGVCRMGAVI